MRTRAAVLVATSLLLGLPLGASPGTEADQDEAIRALIQGVASANNAGDVDRWISFFTADAIYMAPGAPEVTAREDLIEVAKAGFKHDASIDIEPLEIKIFENWAFARTRVTGTVTLHNSREVVQVDVKQIVIYSLTGDGSWRIARMISNSNIE